jgi:hypothetical protein
MTDAFIPDFGTPHDAAPKPIEFNVGEDRFQAYPEIAGGLLMDVIAIEGLDQLSIPDDPNELSTSEIAKMGQIANTQAKKMLDFLDEALLPESAELFAKRMRSRDNPITLTQAFAIGRWLLGEYGARPTEPSSSSGNGRDGSGATSMVGAQPAT